MATLRLLSGPLDLWDARCGITVMKEEEISGPSSGRSRWPFCPLYFGYLRDVELLDPLAAQVF